MNQSANFRRFAISVVIMAAMAPWMITATEKTFESMFNAPAQWVPEHVDYRRDFVWFGENFRGQAIVLISFPGCTLDNDDLDEFPRAILQSTENHPSKLRRELISYATSGRDILQRLTSEPLSLSRRSAVARLRGSLISSDGKSTCAMVALTSEGYHRREDTLAIIRQTTSQTFDVPSEDLLIIGSIVDGSAIDQSSTESVLRYTVPSMLFVVFLCWLSLRSWILTALVVLTGGFGQGLVLALISAQGWSMNAILIVLPVLVYALTVSAGVHLSNYYRDAISQRSPTPSRAAIRNGFVPCLLATLTTLIGLASLSVSDLTPIQDFSLLSCIGLSVTIAVLFLVLPTGMDWQARRDQRVSAPEASTRRPIGMRIAKAMTATIARAPNLIAVAFFLAICFLAVGVASVETSVSIRGLFQPNSKVVNDYRAMEAKLGPLAPVEVILRFDADHPTSPLERMQLVRDCHLHVARMGDVGGTLSAATFFPNIPQRRSIGDAGRRRVLAKRLNEQLKNYVDLGYLALEPDSESWRISTRISAVDDINHAEFLSRLKIELVPLVEERASDGVDVIITGSLPVAHWAQRALLDDLFTSYVTAFTLVAIVMVILLRRLWAGLLVMLPNLFPTFLLFGFMGWMQIPVDIGSVMTSSLALGIAVDDTLHFLHWFRRQSAHGLDPKAAVMDCYCHCGRAITQTSLILSFGLALFAFSDFVPTQRFAGMMIGLLLAALLGDLILLPALLLGRCGKLFRSDFWEHERKSAAAPAASMPNHPATSAADG